MGSEISLETICELIVQFSRRATDAEAQASRLMLAVEDVASHKATAAAYRHAASELCRSSGLKMPRRADAPSTAARELSGADPTSWGWKRVAPNETEDMADYALVDAPDGVQCSIWRRPDGETWVFEGSIRGCCNISTGTYQNSAEACMILADDLITRNLHRLDEDSKEETPYTPTLLASSHPAAKALAKVRADAPKRARTEEIAETIISEIMGMGGKQEHLDDDYVWHIGNEEVTVEAHLRAYDPVEPYMVLVRYTNGYVEMALTGDVMANIWQRAKARLRI